MTEANQKTLYEHFVATNQTESANNILKVYPQFKPEEIPEPIEEPPQPELKPKKKKRGK
ncbi:MAG: hypothetical protein KAJ19_26005 [Gammaproteobacteria bacterium]|nr:hypothetical protein [Gammaproteobacteria bacterium]